MCLLLQAGKDLQAGAKFSSEAGMELQELCSFMLRKGLARVHKPLLWFNGIVQPMPEGGTGSLDREIGQMLLWQHMPMVQVRVLRGCMGRQVMSCKICYLAGCC